MTPPSVTQLQSVLQQAEAARDTAAQVLRQAEVMVQQAEAQARQLHDYRGEFDQRWLARFRQSGTPELLHCHRGFGQRLDQAIHHQQLNSEQLGNRVQQARAVLLAREQRVGLVRKLMQRRQAEWQLQAERRDQRSTDEAAQRAAATGRARLAQNTSSP